MFEGESFQDRLAGASLGAGHPEEVSQVVATFSMSFTFSPRKWLSRKPQRWVSVRVEPKACSSKRAWFWFFSMTMVASRASRVLPQSSWDGFCASWKRAQLLCWFWIKRCSVNLRKKWPNSPELQCHGGNISLERGRCRRPADERPPGSGRWPLPRWNHCNESVSSRLMGNK